MCPDLERVGFPIAQIEADGTLVITKPEGTGGLVSRATVIEQLLYEVHDPHNYLTPDVVLDLGEVEVAEIGPNRVRVHGALGKPPPSTLKATVCVDAGWLGEGEISYAGPNALARAELAATVVRARCSAIGVRDPVRVEVLGCEAIFDSNDGGRRIRVKANDAGEYRVRAAVRASQAQDGAAGLGRSIEPVLFGSRGRRGRAPAHQSASQHGIDPDRSRARTGTSQRRGAIVNLVEVPLHAVAHARAGDKGNRSNISVIPYLPGAFPYLVEQVTEERMRAVFVHRGATGVKRYVLPKLPAMNFVIDNALEGGVNSSLGLDGHGKALSFLVLGEITVRVPRDCIPVNSPYRKGGDG